MALRDKEVFENLRPNKKIGFDRSEYIDAIEKLPNLWEKLKYHNEFYDFFKMGMNCLAFYSKDKVIFNLKCNECQGKFKEEHTQEASEFKLNHVFFDFYYELAINEKNVFENLNDYESKIKFFFERFGKGVKFSTYSVQHISVFEADDEYKNLVKDPKAIIFDITPKNHEERKQLNEYHYKRLKEEKREYYQEKEHEFAEKYQKLAQFLKPKALEDEKNKILGKYTTSTPTGFVRPKSINDKWAYYYNIVFENPHRKPDFHKVNYYEENSMDIYVQTEYDVEYLHFLEKFEEKEMKNENNTFNN